MPPYLHYECTKSRRISSPILVAPILTGAKMADSDLTQLWNQYCEISNASQRARRAYTGLAGAVNFWAGTYEPNRRVNIDILIRNQDIRVRLLDSKLSAGELPLYLPNMAIPVELSPNALLENVEKTIHLEIMDTQCRTLGYCDVKALWVNTEDNPTVTNELFVDRAGNKCESLVSGKIKVRMTMAVENEAIRNQRGRAVRSFELVLL